MNFLFFGDPPFTSHHCVIVLCYWRINWWWWWWWIMVAVWNRADHYIFVLWFLLSFFFFSSSPNLSRRWLDVCHTSTHGVALVRISDAGLKRAARGSLEMQNTKSRQKSPSGHHGTTLSGYIFATKAHIDNRKKSVKQQYLLHMSSQCGELRPSSG